MKLPKHAPWLDELTAEFLRFPHGRHDDIVDAVTLGVQRIWIAMQSEAWSAKVARDYSDGSWLER